MVLLFGAFAWALPLPKMGIGAPPIPVDGYELCWPSGLKVHAVRRPGSSVVSIATVVEGGFGAEADDARGAAHLVEHLWFLSRPDGGPTVEQVLSGVDRQGFTRSDATVFLTTGPLEALGPLLHIEAKRLTDPLRGVDEPTLEKAKRLVRSEEYWRAENVEVRDWALRALSHATSESTPAVHRVETLEQLRAYTSASYLPALTTIRVEGDFDPPGIETAVRAAFPPRLLSGSGRGCDHTSEGLPPPVPNSLETIRVARPVSRPLLVFAWSVPRGFGASDAEAEVAAEWIEVALLDSLGAAPRMGKEPASLDCAYDPASAWSHVYCVAPLTDTADPLRVVDRIRGRLADRWKRDLFIEDSRTGPRIAYAEDEAPRIMRLTPVRLGAFVDVVDRGAAIDDLALESRALYSHFSPGGVDPTGPLSRAVNAVTETTLAEWGARWITSGRMASVYIEPGLAAESEVTAVATPWRLEAPPGTGWTSPRPPMTGWQVETLENGLDVWSVPFPVPLAYTTLVFERGSEAADAGMSLAHEITSYPDYEFEERNLGDQATRAWSVVRTGRSVNGAYGPPAGLDLQLYAVRVATTELGSWGRPSDLLEQPGVERRLTRMFDDVDYVAGERSFGALFPGHPLGTPEWQHLASTRRLTQEDARQWRANVFRPDRAALVVGGNVQPAIVAKEAVRYFDSWSVSSAAGAKPAPPPPPPPRSVMAIEAPGGLGKLWVACRLRDERFGDATRDVVEFLAQQAVSQTLRDQSDLYVVGAMVLDAGTESDVLMLTAAVPSAMSAQAMVALSGILDGIPGVGEEQLSWARTAVLLRFARATSTAWSSMSIAADAAMHGQSLDDLRAYPHRVDAVDTTAIRSIMTDCSGHEAVTYIGPKTELPGATWETMDQVVRSVQQDW